MRYERLFADPSGETHFEEVVLKLDEADYRPPAPMVFVSHAFASRLAAICQIAARLGRREYLPAAAPVLPLPGGTARRR